MITRKKKSCRTEVKFRFYFFIRLSYRSSPFFSYKCFSVRVVNRDVWRASVCILVILSLPKPYPTQQASWPRRGGRVNQLAAFCFCLSTFIPLITILRPTVFLVTSDAPVVEQQRWVTPPRRPPEWLVCILAPSRDIRINKDLLRLYIYILWL